MSYRKVPTIEYVAKAFKLLSMAQFTSVRDADMEVENRLRSLREGLYNFLEWYKARLKVNTKLPPSVAQEYDDDDLAPGQN